MRKWNVLYICFIGVYLITVFYLEDHFKLQSIYWLVIKLTCFFGLFVCLVFNAKAKKENTKTTVIATISVWLLLFGYYTYRDITRYQRNTCQDKFGQEFNQKRQKIGAPEIPANWHISSRNDRGVSWVGDTTKIGHQYKGIFLNANCTLDLEEDLYKLVPIKDGARFISITTKYAKGRGNDSVFYYFQLGGDNRLISSQQADSIFAAEKINKN